MSDPLIECDGCGIETPASTATNNGDDWFCPACAAVETRTAPVWAWGTIDDTLAMDAESHGFDDSLRAQIRQAIAALARMLDLADADTRAPATAPAVAEASLPPVREHANAEGLCECEPLRAAEARLVSIGGHLGYLAECYHAGTPKPPGGQQVGPRADSITQPSLRRVVRPLVEAWEAR